MVGTFICLFVYFLFACPPKPVAQVGSFIIGKTLLVL